MSYAQRQPVRASRTCAIAVVALTQASLGYALATGLAYTVTPKAPDGVKVFDVQAEQSPPPPATNFSAKRVPELQPRVVPLQPQRLRIDAASPLDRQAVLQAVPLQVSPAIAAAAPMPTLAMTQPKTETVPPRSAIGDLQRLIHSEDYPLAAIERGEQGSVTVRLTVDVTGRVGACDIESSSGSGTLDNASCEILKRRALFTPARDSSGNPATDTVEQEIRWMLG